MHYDERRLKDWLALGLVTRLSHRMGYHKDSSSYPSISQFDGEMRRRVWLYVRYLDITTCYQMGLASVIFATQDDTSFPRNLFDTDFNPTTVLMSASRPLEEHTTMSFMICIGHLLPIFTAAIEISHAPSLLPLSEVSNTDTKLESVYGSLPDSLKMRSLDQSLADPSSLIMDRIRIEHMYHNTRCVLYRRFLGTAELSGRRKCLDAAFVILNLQKTLFDAQRPGGLLSNINPTHVLEILNDVMLASTIVGLELVASRQKPGRGASMYPDDLRQEMITKLEISCEVWSALKNSSIKVKRASEMLQKILTAETSLTTLTDKKIENIGEYFRT